MAVNVGDSITAAQYNGLQSRIQQVLGNGSGDFGYGQTLESSQVNAPTSPGAGDGDSITALQMQELHDDMSKAYTHQTGNPLPVKDIAQEDIVGANPHIQLIIEEFTLKAQVEAPALIVEEYTTPYTRTGIPTAKLRSEFPG